MDVSADEIQTQAHQQSTISVKKGMPRNRSIKQLEDKLLNRLEGGWSNSYDQNVGSFSDKVV